MRTAYESYKAVCLKKGYAVPTYEEFVGRQSESSGWSAEKLSPRGEGVSSVVIEPCFKKCEPNATFVKEMRIVAKRGRRPKNKSVGVDDFVFLEDEEIFARHSEGGTTEESALKCTASKQALLVDEILERDSSLVAQNDGVENDGDEVEINESKAKVEALLKEPKEPFLALTPAVFRAVVMSAYVMGKEDGMKLINESEAVSLVGEYLAEMRA